jgi:hypothetical protein
MFVLKRQPSNLLQVIPIAEKDARISDKSFQLLKKHKGQGICTDSSQNHFF